ncbi:peptidase inhibitor family I36 protein [Kutzneria sp. NPDC052558]|uniref:peptidase inhibitor family I36 protein n=1 Tax=Kutzneria sp. NPDC052558 TaxID=3364121 RepID=UPI0037CB2633
MIITMAVVITTAMAGTAAEASARTTAEQHTAGLPKAPRVDAGPTDAKCDAGSFCAWAGADFTGKSARLNLETANPNQCVPLPDGLVARSMVNAMTKDVSVYEGAHCSTEAEFTTYPKGGVYVPNAPFVVRAIQVWQ